MESSLAKEVKVGIFAVIGVVLFCVSVILLGGDKFFFASRYQLKLRLAQVQGIGVGSVVTIQGFPVGNVESIDFVPGSTEVELTLGLNESMQSKVTEGSKAIVKTQGALGDKYIYIEPGPTTAKPLADGGVLEADKTPDFIDILASKGAEMGEIVNVIKEVRILFENINKDERSAKTMANLAEASGELTLFLREGRETFRTLRQDTLPPLASVMKKLDNGQGTLGALINDRSIHTRLGAFLGEAPRNRFLKPLLRESIQTNEEKK